MASENNERASLTVIIPTYNRPECVCKCLDRLYVQRPAPSQIIVVDASLDSATKDAIGKYADVVYLHNDKGRGNTPSSRNMALLHAKGEVIAFLDDDAFVHEGWALNLMTTYDDRTVGGVAGRALNNQPGEATLGIGEIGRLRSDGTLSGYFAADPGRIVDVDHMIGCNMSLRRKAIGEVGGFRDDYKAGPFGICEETEICLRVKQLGYRLVFNPSACCEHIGAQQPGGRRFSPLYTYYITRNTVVMLIRVFGLSRLPARNVISTIRSGSIDFCRRIAAAFAHAAYRAIGLAIGIVAGLRLLASNGLSPVRADDTGQAISEALLGIAGDENIPFTEEALGQECHVGQQFDTIRCNGDI